MPFIGFVEVMTLNGAISKALEADIYLIWVVFFENF